MSQHYCFTSIWRVSKRACAAQYTVGKMVQILQLLAIIVVSSTQSYAYHTDLGGQDSSTPITTNEIHLPREKKVQDLYRRFSVLPSKKKFDYLGPVNELPSSVINTDNGGLGDGIVDVDNFDSLSYGHDGEDIVLHSRRMARSASGEDGTKEVTHSGSSEMDRLESGAKKLSISAGDLTGRLPPPEEAVNQLFSVSGVRDNPISGAINQLLSGGDVMSHPPLSSSDNMGQRQPQEHHHRPPPIGDIELSSKIAGLLNLPPPGTKTGPGGGAMTLPPSGSGRPSRETGSMSQPPRNDGMHVSPPRHPHPRPHRPPRERPSEEQHMQMIQQFGQQFQQSVAHWSGALKQKYDQLSSELKQKISSANFSAISPSELMALDMAILQRLGGRASEAMSYDQQMALFDKFKQVDDVQSMRRVLENVRHFGNLSQLLTAVGFVRDKLSSNGHANDKLMSILMEQMTEKMGDPAMWNQSDVDQMNRLNLIQYIPTDLLLAIEQSQVMDKVPTLSQAQKSEFLALKSAKQKQMTALILHKQKLKNPIPEWTTADINNVIFVLGQSPPSILHQINDSTLYSVFNARQQSEKYGLLQADILLEKLIGQYTDKTPKLTLSNANTFLNKLGSLAAFVTPEKLETLVDEAYRNQTEGMNSLYRTAFRQGDTSQRQKCRVFKKTYMGQNLTQLTTADITVLMNDKLTGCVPKHILDVWLENKKITLAKLSDDSSFQSEGKLRALARRVARGQYSDNTGKIDFASLPAKFMDVVNIRDIKSSTWNELNGAKAKLKEKKEKFNKAEKAMIVRKGLSETDVTTIINAEMGADFNEMLPISDLKSVTADIKKKAAMETPGNSPLRMLSAMSPSPALPERLTSGNADSIVQPGLPQMQPQQIMGRIEDEDVLPVMEAINLALFDADSDNWPSRKMCRAMKTRVAAFTTSLGSPASDTSGSAGSHNLATMQMEDRALIDGLGAADFASVLPSCVIAEIRPEILEQYATREQKIATLVSLGSLSQSQLMMAGKERCHQLTQLGVKAMMYGQQLTTTDTERIGMAATCLDASDISRLSREAFEQLKPVFEDSACLNVDQANAIQNLIIRHYGMPESWLSLEPFCSLLVLFDDVVIRSIDINSLLDECSEDILSADDSQYGEQSSCRKLVGVSDSVQLMDRRLNLVKRYSTAVRHEMDQMEHGEDIDSAMESLVTIKSHRYRRQVASSPPSSPSSSSLTCAAVEETAQGMLPWTEDELRSMTSVSVQLCQAELTRLVDTKERMTVLWQILKQAFGGAALVPLHQIGHVATAIPVSDISALTLVNDTHVAPFGRPAMTSSEQLRAVASRVEASGWPGLSGGPAGLQSEDLLVLGQVVCGMEPANVQMIPTGQIRMLLKLLADAYWCDPGVVEVLAMKAVNISGSTDSWANADVADYGALIGGLSETQLQALQNESMSGLTVAGIRSIAPSKIAALTSHQIMQLSAETAASVSEEQERMFSSEMKMALRVAKLEPLTKSASQEWYISTYLIPSIYALHMVSNLW